MHGKRKPYLLLLAACAFGALAVPLGLHWMWLEIDAHGGDATAAFAVTREKLGVPWWLLAWTFPLLYVAAAGAALALFESVIYRLRVDPADRSWSGMAWTLSGWLPAVIATLVLLAADPTLMMVAEYYAPGGKLIAALGELLPVMIMLLVWHHAYLAAPKPVVPLRFRWPGLLPGVLALAAALAVWLLQEPLRSSPQTPAAHAALAAYVLIAIYLSVAFQLLWLDARRGVSAALREAIRPAVFLPMIVLQLRLWLLFPMLLLPLLPAAWFLMSVAPGLEWALAQLEPGTAALLVHASRFVVAYWWMATAVGFGIGTACIGWLSPVASGRLLYQLGRVPSPAQASP